MKHFAIIGSPVGHSLSPLLHNWVFKALNIQAEYKKIRVEEEELPDIIQQIRNGKLDGCNVTIPHKENSVKFLDEINPRAESISSVNCIMKSNSKIIGNNTDWFGFTMALKENKINLSNKEVIVLGAGGTAKSILFSLKQLGANKIILLNRTLHKAEALKDDIITPYSMENTESVLKNDSIIINTTPIGMQSNKSPIELGLIHKNQTLIDVIYNPLETLFLKQGNKIGAQTLNGLDMLLHQGLASLDLWFGESLSKQVNFTQLKTYLETKLC